MSHAVKSPIRFAANAGAPSSGNSFVYPWYFPHATDLDRGPSDADIRQRFVVSYVWELAKFGHSNLVVRAILGNWQFSGLAQAQSLGQLGGGVPRSCLTRYSCSILARVYNRAAKGAR